MASRSVSPEAQENKKLLGDLKVVEVRPSPSATPPPQSQKVSSDRKRHSIARIEVLRNRTKRKSKPLPADRLWATWKKAPIFVKAILIIIISGFPFAVFMALSYTTFANREVGDDNDLHVQFKDLSLLLSFGWVAFLIIYACAEILASLGSYLCRLSQHTIRYAPLAKSMCFRLTMTAWVGALHIATIKIWKIQSEAEREKNNWIHELRQAFMFLAIAFGIITAQGLCLQLTAIQYIEGYIGPRSERASDELEIIQDLHNLINPRQRHDPHSWVFRMLKALIMPNQETLFDTIHRGTCNEDEIQGYTGVLWATIAGSKSEVSMSDIMNRLLSTSHHSDASVKAEELFLRLDENCDGVVTRDEVENLVAQTAVQLQKRAAAMKGIQMLLLKLEVLLTMIMFGIIVFVYTNFFNQSWAKDVGALWTGIVALSFAFATPVAEVVNSCVFVFARHAYDVGDYVTTMDHKLVVKQIFLTHTNFEEVKEFPNLKGGLGVIEKRGTVVQIAHATLSGEVLFNFTRSCEEALETD